MKSYTDIKQSKKLAKILPIESADMAWCNNSIKGINYTDEYSVNLYTVKHMKDTFDKALICWDKYWKLIPCWSLAALLNIISNYSLQTNIDKTVFIVFESSQKSIISDIYDNPVDACVAMIEKLHNLKILKL